jgi:thymidylate synthase
MKFKLFFIALIMCCASQVTAQANKSEIAKITETLVDYIEGSTNGQPNRLKKAFHSDLNLYYIKNNELKIWSGKKYIESTKEGKPTGETGKIISIDFENDIAVAKVQISHPKSKSPYIDYFMLTKINGHWTIVHKMFTKRVNK